MAESYDVIVVGGGGAGLTAAFTAAGLGKKTLLIEEKNIGGECTWSGCIPSKALLHLSAKAGKGVDNSAVMESVRRISRDVYAHETPEVLAARGVDSVEGHAEFLDSRTLRAGGVLYRARRFILCTGSEAVIPPVPGIESVPYLTNESFFKQTSLPRSMIVIGGGPVGMELSQAMNRLGVMVSVLESQERCLIREDPDAASVVTGQLEEEGVFLYPSARILELRSRPGGVSVLFQRGGEQMTIEAESLLVAAGRRGRFRGAGLEALDLKTEGQGIVVDSRLRTSQPRIYAAGDCVGPYRFSHMAEYQGKTAALNALLPFPVRTSYSHVPWVCFTSPELAHAGYLESELKDRGRFYKSYTMGYGDFDRPRSSGGEKGIVKVLCSRRGQILGAHIAGARAGELISELQVLKTMNIPFHRLQRVIHPYPVYSDILRQLSKQAYLYRIRNHPIVRLMGRLKRGGGDDD